MINKLQTILENQYEIFDLARGQGAGVVFEAYYETLQDALQADPSKQVSIGKVGTVTIDGTTTVILLANIDTDDDLLIDKQLRLILNGYTLTLYKCAEIIIDTEEEVYIDGTAEGSSILKFATVERSDSTSTKFFDVIDEHQLGTNIKLVGGRYQHIRADSVSSSICFINTYPDSNTTLRDCSIEVLAGEHACAAARGAFIEGTLTVENIKLKVVANADMAGGIQSQGKELTLQNSEIIVQVTKAGQRCYGILASPYDFSKEEYVDGNIIIKDCIISAEGGADYSDDQGVAHAVGNAAISSSGKLQIYGGTYYATREALSVSGVLTLIDGGSFEGCQHGNSFSGGKILAKNAAFRNVIYRGPEDCAYKNTYTKDGGCIYTYNDAKVYLDNCLVENTSPHRAINYGIVCNSRGVSNGSEPNTVVVYLSNIEFAGNIGSDLRIDNGKTLYAGVGVQNRNEPVSIGSHTGSKVPPVFDKTTYEGVSFAWDADGNLLDYYREGKLAGVIASASHPAERFYTNLQDAFDFSDTDAYLGPIGAYKDDSDVVHVILYSDIDVTQDIYVESTNGSVLHLNGYKINLIDSKEEDKYSNYTINVSTGLVVDGTVDGSGITKHADNLQLAEGEYAAVSIFRCATEGVELNIAHEASLTIDGGEYRVTAVNDDTGTVIEHHNGQGIYFQADSNTANYAKDQSIGFTPTGVSCVQLTRNGQTFDVGFTDKVAMVKLSDNGTTTSDFFLNLSDNLRQFAPVQDGDMITLTGTFTNAALAQTLVFPQTTFTIGSDKQITISTATSVEYSGTEIPIWGVRANSNPDFSWYCGPKNGAYDWLSYTQISDKVKQSVNMHVITGASKTKLDIRNCDIYCYSNLVESGIENFPQACRAIFTYGNLYTENVKINIDTRHESNYGILCYGEQQEFVNTNVQITTAVENANMYAIYSAYYNSDTSQFERGKYYKYTDCTIRTAANCVGGRSNGIRAGDGKSIITNCDIECTNDGVTSSCAVSAQGHCAIYGGTYFASREALSVHGAPCVITGGYFAGSRHGGAYFGGDCFVKDAKFVAADNRGPVPFDRASYHYGTIYTSGNARLYMDNCVISADNAYWDFDRNFDGKDDLATISHGIVTNSRYDNIITYLSNIIFDGVMAAPVRVDCGRTLYVGKNILCYPKNAYHTDNVKPATGNIKENITPTGFFKEIPTEIFENISTNITNPNLVFRNINTGNHKGLPVSESGRVDYDTYADVEFKWEHNEETGEVKLINTYLDKYNELLEAAPAYSVSVADKDSSITSLNVEATTFDANLVDPNAIKFVYPSELDKQYPMVSSNGVFSNTASTGVVVEPSVDAWYKLAITSTETYQAMFTPYFFKGATYQTTQYAPESVSVQLKAVEPAGTYILQVDGDEISYLTKGSARNANSYLCALTTNIEEATQFTYNYIDNALVAIFDDVSYALAAGAGATTGILFVKVSEVTAFANFYAFNTDDNGSFAGIVNLAEGGYIAHKLPKGKYLIEMTFAGESPIKIKYGITEEISDNLFNFKQVIDEVVPVTVEQGKSYIYLDNLKWAPTPVTVDSVKMLDGSVLYNQGITKDGAGIRRRVDVRTAKNGSSIEAQEVLVSYSIQDTATCTIALPDWKQFRYLNVPEDEVYLVLTFISDSPNGCQLTDFSIKGLEYSSKSKYYTDLPDASGARLYRRIESFDAAKIETLRDITINGYKIAGGSDTAETIEKYFGEVTAFYDNLSDALAEENQVDFGNVGTYMDANNRKNIVLFSDFNIAEPLAIQQNCILDLHGHILTLAPEAYLGLRSHVIFEDTDGRGGVQKTISPDGTPYMLAVQKTAESVEVINCNFTATFNSDADLSEVGAVIIGSDVDSNVIFNGVKLDLSVEAPTLASLRAFSCGGNTSFINGCEIKIAANVPSLIALNSYGKDLVFEDSTILVTNSADYGHATGISYKPLEVGEEESLYVDGTGSFNNSKITIHTTSESGTTTGINLYKVAGSLETCTIEAVSSANYTDEEKTSVFGATGITSSNADGLLSIRECSVFGTTKALSIAGSLVINGGTYEGVLFGNALSGTKDKIHNVCIKHATFKSGTPRTELSYSADMPRQSILNTSSSMNLYMNDCIFVADPAWTYELEGVQLEKTCLSALVLDGNAVNAPVYLSNITFDGEIGADLRVDYGQTVYVGENVPYRNAFFGENPAELTEDKVGIIDDDTYNNGRFLWDDEGNILAGGMSTQEFDEKMWAIMCPPSRTVYTQAFLQGDYTTVPALTLKGSLQRTFMSSPRLTTVYKLNTDAVTNLTQTFAECYELRSLSMTGINAVATSTFHKCYRLEDFYIEHITKNTSFEYCDKLSDNSLKRICEAFIPGPYTLTVRSSVKERMDTMAYTDSNGQNWSSLTAFAESKNWTIAVKDAAIPDEYK